MAWIKSWGAGRGAGGIDEELGGGRRCWWCGLRAGGRKKYWWHGCKTGVGGGPLVLVAWITNWGARGGAGGMDQELGGRKRCCGSE